MACTRFLLQGRQLHNEKVRVVSFACGMPTGPPLHPYQILSNSQTLWDLWPAHDFGFRGDNYTMKTVRVVILARHIPTGPLLHFYQKLSKYV